MKDLLFLHGALGSKDQLDSLAGYLKDYFSVYSLSFSGHDKNSINENNFSIELFANDILEFLAENKLNSVHIFGYSMGGYAALFLARYHPGRVQSIFTLATKFNWTPETAEKEASFLNPTIIEEKVPAFAQTLAHRHGTHRWKKIVLQTAAMMISMGKQNLLTDSDFKKITIPVMLGLGDGDKMVSKEETEKIKNLIPGCQMKLFKDMQHPIEKVNVMVLGDAIKKYFA